MGKFKFLIILILALFLVCGIVMVVDAPSSFDDSVSLIPSDSSVDADSSNCENGTCLVDSNKTEDNSKNADKDSKDDKINYDSKYYVDDFIDGLYFCNDFEYAFKEAKAHNRNVMIIFDGAACIYCEYLKEGTLTDPSVQKEINENHSVSKNVSGMILTLTKSELEQYCLKENIEIKSYAWYDSEYTYLRDWDYYSLETHVNYITESNTSQQKATLCSEVCFINDNYEFVLLKMGDTVILDKRDALT